MSIRINSFFGFLLIFLNDQRMDPLFIPVQGIIISLNHPTHLVFYQTENTAIQETVNKGEITWSAKEAGGQHSRRGPRWIRAVWQLCDDRLHVIDSFVLDTRHVGAAHTISASSFSIQRRPWSLLLVRLLCLESTCLSHLHNLSVTQDPQT